MLRQDQGLLLGQDNQPFGVSQLCVCGLGVALVWQEVLLHAFQPASEGLTLSVPSVWVLVSGSTILLFTDLIQKKIVGCHKAPEAQQPRIVPRGYTDGSATALC